METELSSAARKRERREDEELEVIDVQLALLAYVPVMCLVPVIIRNRLGFVLFHVRQGLALFALEIAAGMTYFLPWGGPAICLMLYCYCVAVSVIAFRRALHGSRWGAPLIGRLASHISL